MNTLLRNTISRRTVLVALAAGLLLAGRGLAQSGEPFPVSASDAKVIPYKYRRREVEFQTPEPAGTIVVDARKRYLYHVHGNGQATRYGVSVGKAGKDWSGESIIKRMVKWPVWVPTPEHIAERPSLVEHSGGMPGGPGNPMGARALYLYQGEVDTVYRIHGTHDPKLIGRKSTAGCFGLLNMDVIHLYDTVQIGTRVVVLAS